jgi:hypothetical protein
VIKAGLSVFVAVGDALCEIRDAKLYRASHGTFEAYCKDRWQISKSQSYRLIDHAIIVGALESAAGSLSPVGDVSERAALAIKPHLAEVTEEIRARVEPGEDPAQG